MANSQERFAMAKQRAAQRAEQAVQDKIERLERQEKRVREIDTEMGEIRKKFRALKSEKEEVQAECRSIKEELEGGIPDSESMTDVPADHTSPQAAPVAVIPSLTTPIPYHWQAVASPYAAVLSPSKLKEEAGNLADESATSAGGASRNASAHPQTPPRLEQQTPTLSTQRTIPSQMMPPTPKGQTIGDSEKDGDTIQVARSSLKAGEPMNVVTIPTVHWSSLLAAKGIENFEIVSLVDGKWTEVGCGVCGKNTMRYGKTLQYIRGAGGMYRHIVSHFKEHQDMSGDEKFGYITRREVSQEDAELMLAGKAPKVAIPMNEGPIKPKDAPGGKRKTESPQAFTPSKKLNTTYGGKMVDDEETFMKRES